MKTYTNLYSNLCSYENIKLAFIKARKRKTLKDYVIDFEGDLENNLKQLKYELETFTYKPAPLTTFIVRDPKTRRISSSHFRDRIVHHALCNIIEPILSRDFIHDSFANQKNKGGHKAIERFEKFMRKVQFGGKLAGGGQHKLFEETHVSGYVLKADIEHYFDTVSQEILLNIIKRKIKDENVIWLIRVILSNHKTDIVGKGMPIGNLTSQFFANVYLNELDRFVKRKLRIKYYIRYVDDFAILHQNKEELEKLKDEIGSFLNNELKIKLHPEKSKIISLNQGVIILGFRIFKKYRLLKKSNVNRIWRRLELFNKRLRKGEMTLNKVDQSLQGWLDYAKFANTYNLRRRVSDRFSKLFAND